DLDLDLDFDARLEAVLARLGGADVGAPVPVPTAGQGYAQTRFSGCPDFFPSRQPPVVPAAPAMRELCFSGFAILHNGRTKTPVFVVERLNRRMLEQAPNIARTDRFYA